MGMGVCLSGSMAYGGGECLSGSMNYGGGESVLAESMANEVG